jgi:hypothetical protein
MSAGSAASNLGYGNIIPYNNVNGNFVNKYSSNNPASFGSNEISGLPGLAGSKNNVDAAAGIVPGICLFKGGRRKLKRKIKNITKRYKKMGKSNKSQLRNKIKSLKKKLRSLTSTYRNKRKQRSRKHRRQRGGYAQYQNNQPFYNVYSTGGILPPNLSALANPVPISKITNEAVDNLNAYNMKGFSSPGH